MEEFEEMQAKLTGKRLRELREIAGLNESDVARYLGCDRSLISLAESGYHKLSAEDAQEIQTFLAEKARKRFNSAFPADAELVAATA